MSENGAGQGVIVCGIDGSPGSKSALREAVRAAARRGDRLRVVGVYEPPEMWATWAYDGVSAVPVPDTVALRENELSAARSMVAEVSEEEAHELSLPEISVEVRPGRAADVLVDLARGADELVVGHRGRGGFGSAVLGSVGLGCVLHATCPVTVVPTPPAAA